VWVAKNRLTGMMAARREPNTTAGESGCTIPAGTSTWDAFATTETAVKNPTASHDMAVFSPRTRRTVAETAYTRMAESMTIGTSQRRFSAMPAHAAPWMSPRKEREKLATASTATSAVAANVISGPSASNREPKSASLPDFNGPVGPPADQLRSKGRHQSGPLKRTNMDHSLDQ
jgi:hypothetical protein